jgi:hypothetical protein
LKGRYLLEGLEVEGRVEYNIILKLMLKKYGMRVRTGLNWLRIGSSSRLL